MATRDLDYLYHHIFLPPCVPQRDDKKNGAGDRALIGHLCQLAPLFRDMVDQDFYTQWSILCRCLTTFGTLHRDNKSISQVALMRAFKDVKNGDVVILHLALQNSGIIMRKAEKDYIVETFEASPPAAEVLAAEIALQWDFPSRAVAIPPMTFEDLTFQASLAGFIEKSSVELVKQFAPTTLKAGSLAFESRDTPTPAIIGQLLMAILEANGHKHTAILTRKRVRDEVCWSDGAENPWRRSALWLVLRVGLQRCLCFLLGGCIGRLHYKFFMCYTTSSFLRDVCSQSSYPHDRIAFARTKLARRVAKLQQQRDGSSSQVVKVIDSLFLIFAQDFKNSLRIANQSLQGTWDLVRSRAIKRVLTLPRYADQSSTMLSLSHSSRHLDRIVVEASYGRQPNQISLEHRSRHATQYPWANLEIGEHRSVSDYLDLADVEARLRRDDLDAGAHFHHHLGSDSNHRCVNFKSHIQQYLNIALRAYESDPESLSSMLLTVMELWKALDTEALVLYPLLSEYDPGFPRNLLHPLQILELSDLRRLQEVEQSLENRHTTARSNLPSIFGGLSQNSFAVRFFNQSEVMQRLSGEIASKDEDAKQNKKHEWKQKSLEYENLLKESADTACLFMEDEFDPLRRKHDDRRCRKHYLERKAARMRIQTHEALLPLDETVAKAVVFELLLPLGFAAWRDTTWRILQLARSSTYSDRPPEVCLHDYTSFRSFRTPTACDITLASRTKSFQDTHYAQARFPTSLDQICLPHGLRYDLYDHKDAFWTSRRLEVPSFASICTPHFPPKSVYAQLHQFVHPTFDGKSFSGNDTIASQMRCPNHLTIAEHTAFQDLRLGHEIQWVRLLRELASSNLNLGTMEVGTLVTELALMAGPSEGQSPLRSTHWIFEDPAFCAALTTQIRRRVESIAANWREGQTLQTLTIILQRAWSLTSSQAAKEETENLLLYVREISYGWTRHLRQEICNAVNVETAQKRSRDGLIASLICRKTFIIEAAQAEDSLKPAALACFLECSFTLKDNLPKNEPGYISKMPETMKRLYISDIRLLHRLEAKIRRTIEITPAAVNQAVNSVWAEAKNDSTRKFTTWNFLKASHDGWITAHSISATGRLEQAIHIDIFEGTFLIDGQPLGRLPDEFTRQGFFHQMFGNRVFLTYPSSMQGMSYMLASPFEGHQIHFGFRDGVVFLRAVNVGRVLELLPREIFGADIVGNAPDLPVPLINNCVHWLDIAGHTVEIRPSATMWRGKLSDWKIDLQNRRAYRRGSLLVDPRSSDFNRVAKLIEPFEDRRQMIVYQPEKGSLSLQMPALELQFKVNYEGLLESRQLRAVIDSDQDAGTMYGLSSSLVIRDIAVPEDRSIIIAMGPARIETFGAHVRVRITHTGYYARFSINKVLQRLECASEPRLIYFKAYCHAVTANILPDPLTGRTGTDEAIHCLQAGNAQPWAPVEEESYRILATLAEISPRRFYYPETMKVLQKVVWNENLLPAVQHDAFRPIVRDIIHQCSQLHRFYRISEKPPKIVRAGDEHLLRRAQLRNQAYRAAQQQNMQSAPDAKSYIPRDCANLASTDNAYEAAILIKKRSSRMAVSHDLAAILQEWPLIQGFDQDFDLYLFTDLINMSLACNWGSIFRLCAESSVSSDRFKLMFLLATVSFDAYIDMTVIRSLIAVSVMEEFKNLQLPCCPVFSHFHKDQVPTVEYLMQYMKPYRSPYPDDARALLPMTLNAKVRRKLEAAQLKHEDQSHNSCKALALKLLSQWPSHEPTISDLGDTPLLNAEQAFLAVQPEWSRLVDNYALSQHLKLVQSLLAKCQPLETTSRPLVEETKLRYFPTPPRRRVQPTLQDLLCKLVVTSLAQSQESFIHRVIRVGGSLNPALPEEFDSRVELRAKWQLRQSAPQARWNTQSSIFPLISELQRIISGFVTSQDPTRRAYGQDLERSMLRLRSILSSPSKQNPRSDTHIDTPNIDTAISALATALQGRLDSIRTVLAQEEQWLVSGGLLPDMNPTSLLEMLPILSDIQGLSVGRDTLIAYGQLIIDFQQLLRIQAAFQRADGIQLANETQLNNCADWQPKDHIDWLLLQIDFNLRIRADQLEVAQAMLSPDGATNFVLQMNMGQGKSSVVIPMLVAQLANGKNLVRVVVPRPLLLQTAQLLQARLGGLICRKVKHIPFSRKSSTEICNLKEYHSLHLDVLRSRGVVLTLPEHMLSFQLSGLQELSNGHLQQARTMMELQEWLSRKSRDILDECDHTLAVKTQLIYPSGGQSLVDAHPTRWCIVQDLLKLVKTHLRKLRQDFPRGIEVIERSPGTFPTVYLLDQVAKDALMHRLVDSVLKGEGGLLPIEGFSCAELQSVASFLRDAQFPKASALKIAAVFKNRTDTQQRLLMLRGLLIHKILLMGLSKRWNVQYGIDPNRDPIAVPFRSKGIPSDQAEYGHPDVSIILTCLSFYYAGLTLPQFHQSLGLLLKSDEPVREFESWKQDVRSFRESLRSFNSINVDDEMQCTYLWSLLRQQMPVINYFLNHFVFPRHARTFERKLVSSGWDIATQKFTNLEKSLTRLEGDTNLIAGSSRKIQRTSTSLTVGFSGTNDNRTLLPLNVVQSDLPGLAHTNAEVLTYLLQSRNRGYFHTADAGGRRLTERDFLSRLKNHGIRMLLDAGAQILELDNVSLAQVWLQVDYEAEAAVYFGEDGRARVIYRDGKIQPLAGSPFLNNLSSCLVYLDEAHTRGVDLKMPRDAKAALTLGIMQTKDHTVQAAMRLRQLAISQSIMFCAPPEVHQSILNLRKKTDRDAIDSHDVIVWLLEQTCCNIEQLQPLYISQGLEYCRRWLSAAKNPNAGSDHEQRKAYLTVLEQPEQYSIEKLYAPDQRTKSRAIDGHGFPLIMEYVEKLSAMKKGLRNTGDTVQALAHQEVEQEREVQVEVEQEREVKKPNHAQALPQPPFQDEVRSFAETGRLIAGSQAYHQAFVALRHTALGRRLGVNDSATMSRLFVTEDFSRTVVTQFGRPRDEYLRSVHWLLWSQVTDTALVLSDFEADIILALIRGKRRVRTHLITYAAPVTKQMLVFDTLKFYAVPALPESWQAPAWLVRDLGIFAGRLYFNQQDQYRAVCETLGLPFSNNVAPGSPARLTEMDLWRELPFEESQEKVKQEPFSPAPLLFMQEWLAIRRKGQEFAQTMMGEICRGRMLDIGEVVEDESIGLGQDVVGSAGDESTADLV
ncbi:hypothetical protein N7G274_005656 [Stereocaulon virgatum]|uniref:ubiquitinyl hydrolase 1 n=1 Tax=Stereocaulon virgatum TaxID=373712 RepID=A0ABR4AAF5_9LECA